MFTDTNTAADDMYGVPRSATASTRERMYPSLERAVRAFM
jgi:hypothetical protein